MYVPLVPGMAVGGKTENSAGGQACLVLPSSRMSNIFILHSLFLFLFEVTSAKCLKKLFNKITYQIYYILCFYLNRAKTQDVITYLISYFYTYNLGIVSSSTPKFQFPCTFACYSVVLHSFLINTSQCVSMLTWIHSSS
jgi:hypothetical protein